MEEDYVPKTRKRSSGMYCKTRPSTLDSNLNKSSKDNMSSPHEAILDSDSIKYLPSFTDLKWTDNILYQSADVVNVKPILLKYNDSNYYDKNKIKNFQFEDICLDQKCLLEDFKQFSIDYDINCNNIQEKIFNQYKEFTKKNFTDENLLNMTSKTDLIEEIKRNKIKIISNSYLNERLGKFIVIDKIPKVPILDKQIKIPPVPISEKKKVPSVPLLKEINIRPVPLPKIPPVPVIDKQISINRSQSNLQIPIFNNSKAKILELIGHTNAIISVIKINENRLVSVSFGNEIRVWNFESQECILVIKNPHEKYIISAIKLDRTSIITGGSIGELKIFDIISGACLNTLNEHAYANECLCLINDFSFASGDDGGYIKFWNLKLNKKNSLRSIKAHKDRVWSLLTMSVDYLISGAWEEIKIWKIMTGECINTITQGWVCFKRLLKLNDNQFASACSDKKIRIWDYKTKICLNTINGHSDEVSCFIKLDENTFASGSVDKTIKIWHIDSGKLINTLTGHTCATKSLEKLNDNDLVSGSGCNDMRILIWKNYREFKEK